MTTIKHNAVKIICIVLALCIIAGGLVYFFTKRGEVSVDSPVVVTTTEEETEKKEEGSLRDTTKITIPLAVIEEKYQKNLDGLCDEYGYASARLNEKDQTVTIKMKTFSYELLLTKIGMRVIKAVYDIQESGAYPFIKEIESIDTENFRKVVIKVSEKKYEKNKKQAEEALSTIGSMCLYYQVHTESDEYKCEILVLSSKTDKLIDTKTYTQ
ncbi:MAG: hypothetical protein IJ262_01890 [Clostridia bacterium]|nr:hypothetical protein [Clostridia bacterium]